LAAAQLDVLFAARGACDFIAVGQGARAALGTPRPAVRPAARPIHRAGAQRRPFEPGCFAVRHHGPA
ncbi:MAG TPA: hypothetical protein DD490_20935, partial [Acidobacteria bacterium]|nr:hypothetical protein [Acidobacteriota bacterium]